MQGVVWARNVPASCTRNIHALGCEFVDAAADDLVDHVRELFDPAHSS